LRPRFIHELGDIHLRRIFEIHLVIHQASRLDQSRLLQIPAGNKNPRRNGGERDALAGDFFQRPGDSRREISEFDRVADFRVELRQQTFLDQRPAAVAELIRRFRWFGFDVSVKRKAAAQSPQLDEPRVFAARKKDHRREGGFAGLFAAEFLQQRLGVGRKCLAGADGQIRAQQTFGLFLNCSLQIDAKGTDGGQCRDAERDGTRKEQQPATAHAAVAPGHRPRPMRNQMREKPAR
jgi:hypothetical protein